MEDIDPLTFYGLNNCHLQMLKSLFPKLRIMARDNVIRVLGDEEDMARIEECIENMRRHVLKYNTISDEDILDIVKGHKTKADAATALIYGPNIKDWPEQEELADSILVRVCSKILDPVTTTDELIPSGETSSYRSNPLGLAEFTLSRRDPDYVGRAKVVRSWETARKEGVIAEELNLVYDALEDIIGPVDRNAVEVGSMIYCIKPGDGSAREQAASCQRVLGGLANICKEYATKRYRSNVINWGMLPFQMEKDANFEVGDYIYVPHIHNILEGRTDDITAYVVSGKFVSEIKLYITDLTPEERRIIQAGCLINFNRNR